MRNKFSVVTIVKNRVEQLHHLIANLENASCKPDELVVVWMAPPSDNSLIKSAHFSIQHCFETSDALPIPRARNKGFRNAQNERIVYMDVDCVSHPDLLGELQKNWESDTLFSCTLVERDKVPDPNDMSFFQKQAKGLRAEPTSMDAFRSSFFALEKANFIQLGGFDEEYEGFGIGDIDFATRCARAGVRMLKIPLTTYTLYRANYQYPLHHLLDIVRNANIYRKKWGHFPATEWLSAFAANGYISRDYENDRLIVTKLPSQEALADALDGYDISRKASNDSRLTA